MAILVGEIAGENNKLALFTHKLIRTEEKPNGKYAIDEMIAYKSFSTEGYSEERDNGLAVLQQTIETFLKENYSAPNLEPIYGACFGIAGPVKSGKATITREKFKANFQEKLPYKVVPVAFLNDMEAIGYSIFLDEGEQQLQSLCHNEDRVSPRERRALMLVSKGLGQALWYWDEKKEALHPIPSEGGHGDFADPTPDKELSQYLEDIKRQQGDNSPISYEQVLSSSGLFRIYQFLRDKKSYAKETIDLMELAFTQSVEQNQKDHSEIIIEKATQVNPNHLSKDALDLFLTIWGAEAGNLALRYTASGGVYVGGSLPIPIEKLRDGTFQKAFTNKEGNFRDYNSRIPIKVFSDPDIVLWGAARYAIDNGFVSKGKIAIDRENQ